MTTAVEVRSYVDLLRAIGIPGIIDGRPNVADPDLAKIAKLNKIDLLYSTHADDVSGDSSDLMKRNALLLKTLADMSSVFSTKSIKYCVFKTIKPFPTTPSDVDILLLKEDFEKAETLLMSSGYARTARDAYSSTLEKEMIVDLQLQPSVSNVPYLPKTLLMKNTTAKRINGVDVITLNPEAELIVIAAHSIFKEQMFTMNDYYSITLLAEQSDPLLLLDLAKSANVLEVVRLAVGLCSQITESVFNAKPKVSHLSHFLGPSTYWPVRNMPIKFPFSLIIKLLLSRAKKDKEMRAKVLPAILRIATPGQLIKLFTHIIRSTY